MVVAIKSERTAIQRSTFEVRGRLFLVRPLTTIGHTGLEIPIVLITIFEFVGYRIYPELRSPHHARGPGLDPRRTQSLFSITRPLEEAGKHRARCDTRQRSHSIRGAVRSRLRSRPAPIHGSGAAARTRSREPVQSALPSQPQHRGRTAHALFVPNPGLQRRGRRARNPVRSRALRD